MKFKCSQTTVIKFFEVPEKNDLNTTQAANNENHHYFLAKMHRRK
jgi:hypothetical protein